MLDRPPPKALPEVASLLEIDERLRLTQDVGGIAVWEYDIAADTVEWSPHGYNMCGVGPEWQPSYEHFLALVHSEDRERVQSTVEQGLATRQPFEQQFRIVTPDGEVRWVISRTKFINGPARDQVRLIGADIDITSLKLTEQRLQEREDELERFQKIAGIAEICVDLREDGVCWYSDDYRGIHGLSPQIRREYRNEWVSRIHPEDRARAEAEFDNAVASGIRTLRMEYRVIRPSDGATRWIEAASEIARDANGLPLRLIAIHRDVTERKEAEEALRRNEQRFHAMLDSMPQIITHIRNDGIHEYYNRRWYEFTGLPEGSTDAFGWPEVFHREDAERLKSSLLHSLDTGEPLESEARIRHHSGDYYWHLCRAVPVRNHAGAIEHWLGTCTNINARKLAEEQARLSAERLQLALDATDTVGTWVWDISNDRTFADAQTARLFSIDPELAAMGVLASTFLAHVDPEYRPETESRIASALEIGGEFDLEYKLVSPEGRLRWISERGRVEHGMDGKPSRALGVSIDITELKQLQMTHELLANELLHRSKNTFSVISALSTLSAKGRSDEVQQYASDFRKRLHSLSAALIYMQSRFAPSADQQQTLMGLLKVLLSPFSGNESERIRFDGVDVPVREASSTMLALLIHEFATNALKHGSLSTQDGTVSISGEVEGEVYVLTWCERGGPIVDAPPERRGFGTETTTRLAAERLGGSVNFAWEPEGITITLRLPRTLLGQ